MDKLIPFHRRLSHALLLPLLLVGAYSYLFSNFENLFLSLEGFGNLSDYQWQVISQLRLPRMLMAIANGILLAVAGAMSQALFKNPLAAPSLIGVSSGASLSAAAAILGTGSIGLVWLQNLSIPAAALVGGTITCLLVFRMSMLGGKSNIAVLILAGVAVNAVCGAFLGLIIYGADDASLRSITFWTMGSIGSQSWDIVTMNVVMAVIVVAAGFWLAKPLTAMSLGEGLARHAGYDVERVKLISIFLVALSVGTSVSFCGLIGFVGLVIPHMSRMLFGAGTKQVLQGCLLLGPLLMLFADFVAKTVLFPAELPIGIVTSGIGGPFFIYLLLRLKKGAVNS